MKRVIHDYVVLLRSPEGHSAAPKQSLAGKTMSGNRIGFCMM